MITQIECVDCHQVFERDVQPGPQPKRCKECRVRYRAEQNVLSCRDWYGRRKQSRVCVNCGTPIEGDQRHVRCARCLQALVTQYDPQQQHVRYERAKANGGWASPANRLRTKLQARYGLSLEDWAQLYAKQGNGCAICGESKELVVDHCHVAGHVRGLLCGRCNKGLGLFDDNPEKLRTALEYLTRLKI